MNLFTAYKRNDDLIVHGARIVLGVTSDNKEISMRIARAHESYPDFQSAVQDKIEQNKRTLDSLEKSDKKASAKLRSDLVMAAFCETCIKSWENVQDKDGTVLECNEANIQRLATELPELMEELFKFASTDSNYVGEFDEKGALKN